MGGPRLSGALSDAVPSKSDAKTAPRCRGVFSIDLEDFAQLTCRNATGTAPDTSPDLDRQIDATLNTLAECNVHATFFVLGMVASSRPDLVRKVRAAGHEIGSHGNQHVPAFRQSRTEFKADVVTSIKLLEDITGERVLGYRAPAFSIVRQDLWALDVLAELGLLYDSSIFPMGLRRYGIEGFDPFPRLYGLPEGGRIVEIPLLVWQGRKRRLPVAGGGYLRLMPEILLHRVVRAIGRTGQTFTLYLHPYEFDPRPLDVARLFPSDRRISPLKRALLNAKWNLRRRTIHCKVGWMCRNIEFISYAQLARQVAASAEPRPLLRA